ncbi:uncharacterized protein J8A68_003458 [[Candida] subhashii]|uniref:EngB-type G domain-containing protein n=1 Tax=[Candida] subhashii TaxID=561895 RepID=A0A8J5UM19_9ASCO|nr:uncharacterized protein J8A68_003458 [[Candida] subhashii]KAG7663031.1 hypothetical protein J8A68_003458 [[Candida] subhashii]
MLPTTVTTCSKLLISKRSINYLVSALPKPEQIEQDKPKRRIKKPVVKRLKLNDFMKQIIKPDELNKIFQGSDYAPFTGSQAKKAQDFFNLNKPQLEWTLAEYEEIPDVKYARLVKERKESYDRMDPINKTDYQKSLMMSKKTFGIPGLYLKPFPEVLFLGHTNVGKSSLINSLVTRGKSEKVTDVAYVSSRAGFTKTLNCFNIGNKLRLMDSPGYGKFGDIQQGEMVTDYISRRHLLKRVFLLIDSVEGFRHEDLTILNHLVEEGVQFDIVFTKTDVVIEKHMPPKKKFTTVASREEDEKLLASIKNGNEKVIAHYNEIINGTVLGSMTLFSRFLFTNAGTNKHIVQEYGKKELRCVVLETCALL